MGSFLLRRFAAALVLLVAVSAPVFFLLALLPDPASAILGVTATPEQLDAKRHELGLDRSVVAQYASWLGHAVRGDFGQSWFTGQHVTDAIADKLSVTLSLTVVTTAVSALLGIGIGMLAAIRRGSLDKGVQVLANLGFALPNLWVALILVAVFAVQLGALPATGYVEPGDSLGGWAQSLLLPVAALAIASVAAVAQQTRNAVGNVLAKDYVRTLRSRGLPRRRLLFKYVLRNAAPLALTTVSLQFIGLLGGALIIEQVFALPGLGSLAVAAATRSDVPTVLGVVVVNLLVDLAVGWLDPKVRVR